MTCSKKMKDNIQVAVCQAVADLEIFNEGSVRSIE